MIKYASRILLVLFVVSITASLTVSQHVQAARSAPATTYYNNLGIQQWPGNTKGGYTQMWIDNPVINSGEVWSRYLELETQDKTGVIQFGIENCNNQSTWCEGTCASQFGGTFHGIFSWSTGGLGGCWPWKGDWGNAEWQMAIYTNSVNGDSELQTYGGPSDLPCQGPCSDNRDISKPWYYIRNSEHVHLVSTNINFRVWGGDWRFNQWMDSNYNFQYQQVSGTLYISGNPPQMGYDPSWAYPPLPGNNGGALASCDYPQGYRDGDCVYRGFPPH